MAQQTINIGTVANDGTGDPIRDAFDKANDNFTELYNGLAGLLDLKGSADCSANPNYPAASKGDAYVVSVAGKIGGASGVVVNAGDVYFATADNAGGTEASVGTSWAVIEGNLGFTPVNKTGDTMTGDLNVPDDAYDATAWNGSTEVPTKNAVRDKIEAIVAGSATVSDTAYGVGWDGDTTNAPSKNAVYDKIETISAGSYTDEQARDAIGTALVAGNCVAITVNDGADTITIAKTHRGALVKKSADQTSANYTAGVMLAFNAETYDTDGIHDNVTNNTRLTVPANVTKVRLKAQAGMANVTNSVVIVLEIYKGGSAAYDGFAASRMNIANPAPHIQAIGPVISVSSGDYFEAKLTVTTDTSIDITAQNTWFEMEIIE